MWNFQTCTLMRSVLKREIWRYEILNQFITSLIFRLRMQRGPLYVTICDPSLYIYIYIYIYIHLRKWLWNRPYWNTPFLVEDCSLIKVIFVSKSTAISTDSTAFVFNLISKWATKTLCWSRKCVLLIAVIPPPFCSNEPSETIFSNYGMSLEMENWHFAGGNELVENDLEA